MARSLARRQPEAQAAGEAIVGGQLETRFPAVGYLVRDGRASCTGTLVEPDLVLTAAHCVVGVDTLAFGVGDVREGRTIAAKARAAHPRYVEPTSNGGLAVQGFDVAFVRLTAPAPVAPMPMAAPPTSGKALSLGYGSTAYGPGPDGGEWIATGAGTDRKSADAFVVSQNPVEVFVRSEAGAGLCYGDSGGPLILDGHVTGTLSRFVGTTRCTPGDHTMMAYTRVDVMADFLRHAHACFDHDDVAACLREPARALCKTPRSGDLAHPLVVKADQGTLADGSMTASLVAGEQKALRLAPAAAVKVTLFSQGDAHLYGPDGQDLGTETTLGAGSSDLVLRSCNGEAQGYTLIWAPP